MIDDGLMALRENRNMWRKAAIGYKKAFYLMAVANVILIASLAATMLGR